MTNRYLLPCPCQREIPVDVTQAGQEVTCECGRAQEVPTMRELRRLKRVEATAEARQPASTWGARQAVLLLGFLVTAVGIAPVTYLYMNRPKIDPIEELSPFETWLVWQQELRPGIERPTVQDTWYRIRVKYYRRWMGAAGVLVVVGVVTMIVSLLIPKKGVARRRRPAGGQPPRAGSG